MKRVIRSNTTISSNLHCHCFKSGWRTLSPRQPITSAAQIAGVAEVVSNQYIAPPAPPDFYQWNPSGRLQIRPSSPYRLQEI